MKKTKLHISVMSLGFHPNPHEAQNEVIQETFSIVSHTPAKISLDVLRKQISEISS